MGAGIVLAVVAVATVGLVGASVAAQSPPAGQAAKVIAVLGDSTGNDPGEWVDLWAKHLGESRRVVEHTWSWKYERWNDQPIRYGKGPGVVTIWNGSMPGAQPKYALDRLAVMLPVHPDLLVLNYGHNGFPQDTTAGLARLKAAADTRTWVVLQNPGLNDHAAPQEKNLAAVAAWAKSTDTPVIDVTSAFRARGPASLMRDHAHPNAAGSALWESVVEKALG